MGDGHSYFLDSTGIVWVCGLNNKGQLGLGHNKWAVKEITCIDYFVKNNIVIKHIESGAFHVIMRDCNNCVWTVGDNYYGQIGDGSRKAVNEPKEVVMFRDCSVEEIKSGPFHVYVKCDGDKYYFWGNNAQNQCLAAYGKVTSPHLLNFKDMQIKGVFLGHNNTKFIL